MEEERNESYTKDNSRLEDELSRKFIGTQGRKMKGFQMNQALKEWVFTKDFLKFADHAKIFNKIQRTGTGLYMSNVGEASLIQRRVDIMKESMKTLQDYLGCLKSIIHLYDLGMVGFLKEVTHFMGYTDPSYVVNRYVTLHSMKKVGLKQQEELSEELHQLTEELNTVKSSLILENIVLSNTRSSLNDRLYALESEIEYLNKDILVKMQTTNETVRLNFQITNFIDTMHRNVTTRRGYPSGARTDVQKLDEIRVRMEIMSKGLHELRTKPDVANHSRLSRQSSDSIEFERPTRISRMKSTNANAQCDYSTVHVSNKYSNNTINLSLIPGENTQTIGNNSDTRAFSRHRYSNRYYDTCNTQKTTKTDLLHNLQRVSFEHNGLGSVSKINVGKDRNNSFTNNSIDYKGGREEATSIANSDSIGEECGSLSKNLNVDTILGNSFSRVTLQSNDYDSACVDSNTYTNTPICQTGGMVCAHSNSNISGATNHDRKSRLPSADGGQTHNSNSNKCRTTPLVLPSLQSGVALNSCNQKRHGGKR